MSAASRLYLPLQRSSEGADRIVDLRILRDGRVGLTAYTSLRSLVDHCGDNQPWGLIDDKGLAEIRLSTSIDVILLDAELPMHDKQFRQQTVSR